MPDADGAILGASIRTLDDERPRASALAWRDGVLVAVGDDAEVRESVGPRTRVIDGRGMAVVPGLTDSHIHPFWGTRVTRGVDLRSAATLDEVRARLAADRVAGLGARAQRALRGVPRVGAAGGRDRARRSGDRPAVIYFFDGHTALASHTALALAGITGAREFDESAEIVVDADGRPTGRAARERGHGPRQRRRPEVDRGASGSTPTRATLRAFNRVGLTGAHVMVGTPELLDDVRALEQRGELTLRMVVPMHQEPAIGDEEVERRLALAGEHGRLWRAGTAKFFLDGVLESGTAWLLEPGPNGENAHPFWPSVERYAELVRRFTAAGFSAITHAVGDGAVRGALDAYEAAGPPARGMHRVEHIETLVDADLPRFAALGVAASMQPLHMEGLDDPDTPSAWRRRAVRGALRARVPLGRPRARRARCSRSARTGWSPTTTRASGWPGRGCGARPGSVIARRTCRRRR